MSEETVSTIESCLKEMPEGFTSGDLFAKLRGRFSYGQVRAVMNHSVKNSGVTTGET
jgi:hypothetical protein